MNTDELAQIDGKLEELIKDKTAYSFSTLKQKVEEILKNIEMFLVDGETDSKAIDLYLKKVITKRNNLQKEAEKSKVKNTKEERYFLIETICKKLEFESQEELIEKINELEKKTNFELNELNNSF